MDGILPHHDERARCIRVFSPSQFCYHTAVAGYANLCSGKGDSNDGCCNVYSVCVVRIGAVVVVVGVIIVL